MLSQLEHPTMHMLKFDKNVLRCLGKEREMDVLQ